MIAANFWGSSPEGAVRVCGSPVADGMPGAAGIGEGAAAGPAGEGIPPGPGAAGPAGEGIPPGPGAAVTGPGTAGGGIAPPWAGIPGPPVCCPAGLKVCAWTVVARSGSPAAAGPTAGPAAGVLGLKQHVGFLGAPLREAIERLAFKTVVMRHHPRGRGKIAIIDDGC